MIRQVRRAALVMAALASLWCAMPAAAGTAPAPALPAPGATATAQLDADAATAVARTSKRLADWLDDHPISRTTANHDPKTGAWTVSFIDAAETTQAVVLVDDARATVTETRTGPQVAWQMARGYEGAFGRSITKYRIWIPLLLLFVLPFITWRRLVSWRTLDLLAMSSLTLSLVWFNRGEIFTSVPLQYPPLVYLALRLAWVGLHRGRVAHADLASAAASTPDSAGARITRPRIVSWCPTWLLLCLLLVALGLRLGLNAFDSNVVDVGYAGAIGADRIAHGQTPYGTFPSDCGQCDTYGPVTYLTYVPFEAAFPWVGKWNDVPAAHGAAVAFDLIALLGMVVLGWRLGGRRLAAGLGLAWVAFPFTAYALESNTNDTLVAACLVWGLVLVHRPLGRAVSVGLAALAKFTPAILLVLWSRHPFPRSEPRRRRTWIYVGGLALTVLATGWVVLLDGFGGIRTFWDRTVGFQIGRDAPFSLWGQYPWLQPVQIALGVAVAAAAVAVAWRPRHLDVRGFIALSGALMLGIQLTMTYWFYLYVPWFLPFAIAALIPEWPERIRTPPADPAPADPATPDPAATEPPPVGAVV